MTNQRLRQQLEFIREIDKLKSISRVSVLIDGSRRENSAEHSWHLACMATVLLEYAKGDVDLSHAMQLALIHDLVEIDAGDTYVFDESANADKAEREQAAAKRIFDLLPEDQGKKFSALWYEFEEGKTDDARFARALDRLAPFMLNYYSGGSAWKDNGIKRSQILWRMDEVRRYTPGAWAFVEEHLDDAVDKGWVLQD